MASYNPGSGGRASTDTGAAARSPKVNDRARKNFKWFTYIPLNRTVLGVYQLYQDRLSVGNNNISPLFLSTTLGKGSRQSYLGFCFCPSASCVIMNATNLSLSGREVYQRGALGSIDALHI